MSKYRFHRPNRALSALCTASLLSGCLTLANAAPRTVDIFEAAQPVPEPGFVAPYDVVPIIDSVVAKLERRPVGSLSGSFGGVSGGQSEALGVGNVVGVSIYEASSGVLFGSSDIDTGVGAKNVQLPLQQIDQAGYVSVLPFAGRIRAGGRTTAQVGAAIRAALSAKAVDPQVIVTLNQNAANLVTVFGEVGQGGWFPISLRGDRVLDAIASAGGPRAGAHEIYVRLTRGGCSSVARLSTLVARPQENVSVHPGDDIFLYRKPDTFTALGASAANNSVSFEHSRLSLVEEIGKARGLDDNRADSAGAYLFRYEGPRIYAALHLNSGCGERDALVPGVYHLDLKNPQSLLLTQWVEVHDKDVIYVSNAVSGDAIKFFRLIGASVGIVGTGVTLSRVGLLMLCGSGDPTWRS